MIANARMYSHTPAATAAWRDILLWATRAAGVPVEYLEYPSPRPLAELWARDDLVAVQMCGLPASLRAPSPIVLAAPVPSLPRYQGRPIYMTDLAVRAGSAFRTLEDTFGGVAGYTVKDSQSGYYAFRSLLLAKYPQAHYRRYVGGLIHARGVMQALADGRIDIGPLDAYLHDLIRAGDPALAAQVRVVASTDPTPMPPLVATAPLKAEAVDRIRKAFLEVHENRELDGARQSLLLERFAVPDLAVYDETKRRAALVEKAPAWP